MAKKKMRKSHTPSSENLAKMKAGRERAAAEKARIAAAADEQEFEPTDVSEQKAAGTLKTPTAPALPSADVPAFPPPLATGEDEEEISVDTPQIPAGPAMEVPTMLSQEQMATMLIQLQQTVIQLQQQNPQAVAATPDQRLDETVRMMGAANPNNTDFNQARIGRDGVQGVVFKYPIDRGYYSDPTPRLLEEERLARYALAENYQFRWTVDGVEYQKHGVTYTEPRFMLELFRLLDDPETGERNGKMARVARQMQHEDEMFTRMAAMKLGILDEFPNTEDGFKLLMDEVRYQRMRQWLFDIFTPPKIEQHNRRSTTQVIAGKAVEVFDTEKLTDHDAATDKVSAIQATSGVGKVVTPRI